MLVVLLNMGIGGLALWSYRTHRRAAERLMASDVLDAYHAAWLLGSGFGAEASRRRESDAAEMALEALVSAGSVQLDQGGDLVLTEGGDQARAVSSAHPLERVAWRFSRDALAAGSTVTVEGLAAHSHFRTACVTHSGQLAEYLPSRHWRHDDLGGLVPMVAGLIAAGWFTVNTCLVMVLAFRDETDWSDSEDASGVIGGVMFLTLLTAVISAIVLMVLHMSLWLWWKRRWPRRLRRYCRALVHQRTGGGTLPPTPHPATPATGSTGDARRTSPPDLDTFDADLSSE
ncbi:hypothetical protein [Streptomyces albipurpureus]|uniref:Uncharacterized protein n=1 Tax=Streptomyces albipurpureus TaxID=2897419 RepID=A0ABT0UN95_9ACTN|nr:hypothetical protein [Streptomyces sp. CWNU-1]MCM2388736.1 hypothetical protein [Streptomyces sp. CWNU-1]